MTPEEIIRKVVETGAPQMVRADLMSLNRERQKLGEAALKVTDKPIMITTRTENGWPFFIVRLYDIEKESIPYEQVEREAKEKGWVK